MPDYTTERKSKLIQVCPKCGRKGKRTAGIRFKKDGPSFSMYKHVSKFVRIAGIAFEEVLDACHVPDKETA